MSIVSIVLLILMGMDKSRAKNHEWRIAERTLFTPAIAGGQIGVYWVCIYSATKHVIIVLYLVFPTSVPYKFYHCALWT